MPNRRLICCSWKIFSRIRSWFSDARPRAKTVRETNTPTGVCEVWLHSGLHQTRSKTLSLQEIYQVDIWLVIHHSISKHQMPPIGDPESFILSPMGSKQLLPFALCSVMLGDVWMGLTESKGNSTNWILPLSLPSMVPSVWHKLCTPMITKEAVVI